MIDKPAPRVEGWACPKPSDLRTSGPNWSLPPHPIAAERECANADCGWVGHTQRYCGSVGPLCPECGEITE